MKARREPSDSVRLPPRLRQDMEQFAKKRKVSSDLIVQQALERFLADAWRLEEGERRLDSARRGDFAPEEKVKALFKKW